MSFIIRVLGVETESAVQALCPIGGKKERGGNRVKRRGGGEGRDVVRVEK